ncbi:MAG: trypsin-like peptidase domain-containing protein [Blautia sp.]|nr:trypsin-like peptidase domain-containing protein [Blautia sp.]
MEDDRIQEENRCRDDGAESSSPHEYSYSSEQLHQDDLSAIETDNGHVNDTQIPPRYGYYQVHRKQPEYTQQEERKQRRNRAKHRDSLGKKAAVTAVLAVMFGLIAGVVFQGVNFAAKSLFPDHSDSQVRLETTAPVTVSDNSGNAAADIIAETGTVAGVAEATMPSVVAITSVSVQEIYSFFGSRQYQSAASGSGIIVGENDNELLIATNNHVVEGATTLSVCFIGNDVANAEQETTQMASSDVNLEDAVSAKIKGVDTENDLAVVAVEKSDIPEDTMSMIKIAQIGDSDSLSVGDQVVAIGNALGYGQSVTSGWISALNRSIEMEDGTISEMIQTDAAINAGNSGGALLNMKGELIGINSAKNAASGVEGMGYAIPITKAQPILEELMNRKTRDKVSAEDASYLGVQLADLSSEAIQMYNMPAGAFVIETVSGEAAEQCGIRKGDIIVKLDGQKVSGRDDLISKLEYYKAGETVEIIISRSNNGEYEEMPLEVTLGARQ